MLLSIILVTGGGFCVWYGWIRARAVSVPALPAGREYAPLVTVTGTRPSASVSDRAPEAPTSSGRVVSSGLPTEWRLAVPFLSQAPKKDWAMPYQEACEEASMIMTQAYFAQRTKDLAPDEGDEAILHFLAWQAERFGPGEADLTVAQTAEAMNAYFENVHAEPQPFKDADQIRRALVDGYPVIIPADGKQLANPHFRNGGPRYHMLVIVGYLADGRWITNDPGTQFGKGFLYPQENLLESIHDWNGGDVPNGEPTILIVKPKEL